MVARGARHASSCPATRYVGQEYVRKACRSLRAVRRGAAPPMPGDSRRRCRWRLQGPCPRLLFRMAVGQVAPHAPATQQRCAGASSPPPAATARVSGAYRSATAAASRNDDLLALLLSAAAPPASPPRRFVAGEHQVDHQDLKEGGQLARQIPATRFFEHPLMRSGWRFKRAWPALVAIAVVRRAPATSHQPPDRAVSLPPRVGALRKARCPLGRRRRRLPPPIRRPRRRAGSGSIAPPHRRTAHARRDGAHRQPLPRRPGRAALQHLRLGSERRASTGP